MRALQIMLNLTAKQRLAAELYKEAIKERNKTNIAPYYPKGTPPEVVHKLHMEHIQIIWLATYNGLAHKLDELFTEEAIAHAIQQIDSDIADNSD